MAEKKKSSNNHVNPQKERRETLYKKFEKSYDNASFTREGRESYAHSKMRDVFANIYLLALKNNVVLFDYLNHSEEGAACTVLMDDMIESIKSGYFGTGFDVPEVVVMWLIAISEGLGVPASKLFSLSRKEKRDIVYSFIENKGSDILITESPYEKTHKTAYCYEMTDGSNDWKRNLFCDLTFYIIWDTENDVVALTGDMRIGTKNYNFPNSTLYYEAQGDLYDFYFESAGAPEREKQIVTSPDLTLAPKDALFRFFNPPIACITDNRLHTFEDIRASVYIISNETKEKQLVYFEGNYCSSCGRCFISEKEYTRLRSMGILCCRIIETYEDAKHTESSFTDFSKESVLFQYGYNVNSAENLSEEQRRNILMFVLENDILSRGDIIRHIEMLINISKNTRNRETAVNKWKSDISFIENYNRSDKFVIQCDGIRPYKIKEQD